MFEDATGQRLVRMELKYCEGCGGLLLRRSGEAVVYCAGCQEKLAELPLTTAEELPSAAAARPRTATHKHTHHTHDAERHPEIRPNADSIAKLPPQSAVSTNGITGSRRMA